MDEKVVLEHADLIGTFVTTRKAYEQHWCNLGWVVQGESVTQYHREEESYYTAQQTDPDDEPGDE